MKFKIFATTILLALLLGSCASGKKYGSNKSKIGNNKKCDCPDW